MKQFPQIIRSTLFTKAIYNGKGTPNGMNTKAFPMRISAEGDEGSEGIWQMFRKLWNAKRMNMGKSIKSYAKIKGPQVQAQREYLSTDTWKGFFIQQLGDKTSFLSLKEWLPRLVWGMLKRRDAPPPPTLMRSHKVHDPLVLIDLLDLSPPAQDWQSILQGVTTVPEAGMTFAFQSGWEG